MNNSCSWAARLETSGHSPVWHGICDWNPSYLQAFVFARGWVFTQLSNQWLIIWQHLNRSLCRPSSHHIWPPSPIWCNLISFGLHWVVHSSRTPLGVPDHITGMYVVQRSTRRWEPNTELVTLDRFVWGCHLIGKASRFMDHTWTSENVLQKAMNFWVNNYINHDMFTITRNYWR